MRPIEVGLNTSLRGLRTGNQRALFSGVALLLYGVWRRQHHRRELIYRRVLRQDEAILVKTGRGSGERIVIDDNLARQVRHRSSAGRTKNAPRTTHNAPL
ncbi:MAG: hypothetical protein Q8Q52_02385 [Acidimicrobiia bacterium]|nr:hypothetical protein [Acidimicrobiia bacterium]